MKKFLLLLHEDAEQMSKLSPKDMKKLVQAHLEWATKLRQFGHMLAGVGYKSTSITF